MVVMNYNKSMMSLSGHVAPNEAVQKLDNNDSQNIFINALTDCGVRVNTVLGGWCWSSLLLARLTTTPLPPPPRDLCKNVVLRVPPGPSWSLPFFTNVSNWICVKFIWLKSKRNWKPIVWLCKNFIRIFLTNIKKISIMLCTALWLCILWSFQSRY